MTDEEKRFKVLQVEKYEEQKDKAETTEFISTALLILSIGAALAGFVAADITSIVASMLRVVGLSLGFNELRVMIEAISKKVTLKNRIEEIQDELKFSSEFKEEQRGIKK